LSKGSFVYLQSFVNITELFKIRAISKKNNAMTTIQLKKSLMHQIADIEDISFLNALKTIIETKTKSNIIQLSNEQRNEIVESKKQIENGEFTNQEDLNQDFEKWLSAN
jgi:hypothetical protein